VHGSSIAKIACLVETASAEEGDEIVGRPDDHRPARASRAEHRCTRARRASPQRSPREGDHDGSSLDPDERLTGAVAMTALLRINPQALLADLTSPVPVVLSPDADASEVALGMTDYDMHTAPVVDESGRVVGIVTADDVLELAIPEDWHHRLRARGE
jgi:hypothetical protein